MLIKYNDDRQAEENYISIGYIDENKVETIEFEFPDYLKNLSKKIIIRNNEKKISLVKLFDDVVTNKFTFTKDVTKFDKILFSVDFFEEDKEDTILYKTKPLLIFFRESLSCDDEISEDEPKLKILDDLIIKVGKCITETEKAAENANTQAEYAKEQADNVKIANEEAKKIIDKFEANVGDYTKSAKSEIDKEAKTQTDNFNSNAEKTIKEYNANSSTKIKEYNDNAAEKLNEYTNTVKTKTDEFNQNAENKLQEYNDNAEILKEKVDLLESNLEDVKASGENIEIDDALEYYTDSHRFFGKSEQETRELSQDTASGEEVSLINVETSKDIDIFVDGNYKQGENPSPENEQPIEVIDGCNRFDVQEFQNQFVAGKILNDDGNEISDSTSQYSKYKIFLKANKSYRINGSIGLKFSGKNKVDFINYAEKVYDSSKVEKMSDGSYKFKHSDKEYSLYEGLLKAPSTLSWYVRNDGTTTTAATTFNFKVYYEDGTSERIAQITSPDFKQEIKKLTKNVTKITNTYYTPSPFAIIKDVQLEEVSTATPYEPYHEPQLIPIDLAGNSIAKINDSIKDELEIYRNGKITLKKEVNRYSFSGNEKIEKNTNYSTDSMLVVQFNKSDMKVGTTNILCNYFKYSSSTIINSIRAAGDYVLFGLDKATFTDVDSFKSYLLQQYENETAVYIDYELATPQTIELPSIDPLQLWEGTVNVELISNLATNMNVNYNIVPAKPSLEAKSDIESTGEKYNIFNKDARIITSGTTKENLDTGVRVIGTIDGQYRYCSIELGKKELLGKNITMQAKMQSSNQNVGLVSINFGNENSPAIKSINSFNKEYEKKAVSIPTEFPENCDRIYLILYANLNGTLKKGDYVDYKDLMVSIGSNEKPYVPYDIGAINIKQQNENLLNTFDYTYVSGDKNITFKNGQFIFNGTWEKWLAQLYTWSLTNYWAETNYADYMDLSKKSVNILKAGKYYLKIKYISGNISTNGGLKFTYRLDTNTTGKSLNIGEFKSNVKKGDIIKKTIEITEDTPFTLMTTMIRREDTSYDNFTFTAILEKDEETENFEEHKEVNHQMILSKALKGIKTTDSSKANYIDENGAFWITDYVDDDGIHKRIGKITLDGSEDWKKYKNWIYIIIDDCALSSTSSLETANLLSNKFIATSFNDIANKANYGITHNMIGNREKQKGICFNVNNYFDSVDTIKAFFSTNNTEVYYVLAEETLEDFTEEERKSWNEFKKLKTFKGKNYISSVDDIQAGLEFSYKKDSRISTQKELDKCNERLSNIENLLNTTETSALLLDNLENELKKEVE